MKRKVRGTYNQLTRRPFLIFSGVEPWAEVSSKDTFEAADIETNASNFWDALIWEVEVVINRVTPKSDKCGML